MDTQTENEDRLLSAAEREMVAQTRPPSVTQMSQAELHALGKRLREARDRSRRVAAPARDNTGALRKTAVLVRALQRVTAALRKLNNHTSA
jgi:hypothetical protein